MDTRETPVTKAAEAAAPPERTWRHMCFGNTKNFPYPRRNGFSTDRPVLPIVTQKREVTCDPSDFFLNGFSTSQISLQIKNRTKINIGVRLNMNLRGEDDPDMICLATRQRNENSSMMLKKKVLIINTQ